MKQEDSEALIELILGSTMDLREAMMICDIEGDPLAVEDELFTLGLETCSSCGVWLPSQEFEGDSDELYCVQCSA